MTSEHLLISIVPGTLELGRSLRHEVLGTFTQAGLVVQTVLVILFAMSIISWSIIALKMRLLRATERKSARFLTDFRENGELPDPSDPANEPTICPHARMLYEVWADIFGGKGAPPGNGPRQGDPSPNRAILDRARRVMKRAAVEEIGIVERHIPFLATTGSTAPFIGLFGTVWGIMNAFRGIGITGAASLAVVAPGISEALIATAVGLATAIPAVIGYNHFLHRVRKLSADMENFGLEVISLLEQRLESPR